MSEEHVNPVATSGERDKNEADSFNVTALIAEARGRRLNMPEIKPGGRVILPYLVANRIASLLERLAAALEAATRERDAATEARIDRWMQLVGKGVEERLAAEAERDAALAAIERLRSGLESAGYYEYKPHKASSDLIWAVGVINAALDGAPEPEGVWEYRARTDYGRVVAQGSLDEIGHLSGHIWERRRKAGPWLPVEGAKP